MSASARYIFRPSVSAHTQITELFDFIHPTMISMWNLRWQVRGFVESNPNIDQSTVSARFSSGIKINSGAIKKSCVDTTWDEQVEFFASILLTNTISIFEDYCAQIALMTNLSDQERRKFEKNLQFPSQIGQGVKNGYSAAVDKLGPKSADSIGTVTYDKRVEDRIQSGSIEDLLHCYRYFKEVRNSLAHNGKRASESLLKAQIEMSNHATALAMILNETPQYNHVNGIGEPVHVSLRGVIGLCDVILRIVSKNDATFTEYSIGKKEVAEKFKELANFRWQRPAFQGSADQIARASKKLGLPQIQSSPSFISELKVNGCVPDYF